MKETEVLELIKWVRLLVCMCAGYGLGVLIRRIFG